MAAMGAIRQQLASKAWSKPLKVSPIAPKSHPLSNLPTVMTRDKIEAKRVDSLRSKIDAELDVSSKHGVDYIPNDLIGRYCSRDLGDLKGLFHDCKSFNNRLTATKKEEVAGDYAMWSRSSKNNNNNMRNCGREGAIVKRELDVKDENIVGMARRIVGMSDLNLEFSRVVKAYRDPYPLDRHVIIEARNVDVARVPIFIKAKYSHYHQKVRDFHFLSPEPFMKVVRKDKKNGKCSVEMKENTHDCKALLYANIKNCPILDKRLGLNKKVLKHKLNSWVRGKVSKVPKDDGLVPSLAKLVVLEQNQIGNQRARLRFVRVLGDAWVETFSKDTLIYHMMVVASETGMEKVFYAAVMGHSRGQLYTIIDWAPASQYVTMPLP